MSALISAIDELIKFVVDHLQLDQRARLRRPPLMFGSIESKAEIEARAKRDNDLWHRAWMESRTAIAPCAERLAPELAAIGQDTTDVFRLIDAASVHGDDRLASVWSEVGPRLRAVAARVRATAGQATERNTVSIDRESLRGSARQVGAQDRQKHAESETFRREKARTLESWDEAIDRLRNIVCRMVEAAYPEVRATFVPAMHAEAIASTLSLLGREPRLSHASEMWKRVDRATLALSDGLYCPPNQDHALSETIRKHAINLVDEFMRCGTIDAGELTRDLVDPALIDAPRVALHILTALGNDTLPDWLVRSDAPAEMTRSGSSPVGADAKEPCFVQTEEEDSTECDVQNQQSCPLTERQKDLLSAYLAKNALSPRSAVSLAAAAQKADPGSPLASYKQANSGLVKRGLLAKLPEAQGKRMYLTKAGQAEAARKR